jgi:ATP-dependent exoDNAse (exonuclease V) beta subunit
MRYVDENGTAYQGFIDMLLETPDGYIIIDHKTHPRQDNAAEYCAKCAPQLNLYKKAVEEATGKKVIKLIIHLPNLGCCYRIILS